MKIADGGFRPAFNAQYATDTPSQVIVGVAAVTLGSDMGQLVPMVEQVGARCGQHPAEWLVDGGYPSHEQLDQAAEHSFLYAFGRVPNAAGEIEIQTLRAWLSATPRWDTLAAFMNFARAQPAVRMVL